MNLSVLARVATRVSLDRKWNPAAARACPCLWPRAPYPPCPCPRRTPPRSPPTLV